ncbi:tetratricopeptide repeat protein [Ramlibacter tataouinensis]|uniref:FlbA protein-like protein n=1 Tax=Ramlibacter tataouinensis (strain ATCC BAA-407 / DSM 14655 / LMG 21543 / TTB310) TaxID=365046 RepID=F5XY09_RAMTT|nr:tetratricopeptide repeat-containing glycosyltransferase family protein [Ramlibacter tataouinensis]AEG94334.1 FlbA protein-like protein [Ramlibacter tataouinensis TTB310]
MSASLLAEALAQQRAGHLPQAETLCRGHLAQAPQDAAGLALLGLLVAQRGALDEGARLLQDAVQRAPAQPMYRFQLGLVHQQAGSDAQALAAFDGTLAAGLKAPAVHNARGLALKNLGRLEEAVAAYDAALAQDARFLPALNNRGVALHALGRFEEALPALQQAVALGASAQGRVNLAITLNQLHRHAEAEALLRQVLKAQPQDADARLNLGTAVAEQGRRDEALEHFRAVLAQRPGQPEVLMNIANTLRDQGRHEQALQVYDQALALQPVRADLRFNRSLSLLAAGRLREGWADYEARWQAERLGKRQRGFAQPQWRGKGVAGRTVLVHAEQGLGDTLQFCRYVPLLAQQGARVVLEVQPLLHGLLRSLPGVAQLLREGEPLPAFDLHCPMMSLPLAFGTTMEGIPASVPYLQPDAALVERWRRHLAGRGRPQIGVAWSGNPANWNDHRRSVALERFRAALPTGADYWSLKHDMPALADDGLTPLHRFPETGFEHMAAQACALDGVISICTAVAHLAGALGRPTAVLLSRPADWRWFEEREDNPWYPTARLLRQRTSGDWDSVFARLPEALARTVPGFGAPT